MKSIIVIGAGPAGLLAAGTAAQNGAKTILLEKMDRPGRKLSITGKGRCNLTNIAPLRDFIQHFGKNGKFLYQAFSRFFSDDLLTLLTELEISTVTERGGRVFPKNVDASEVSRRLKQWVIDKNVELFKNQAVKKILFQDDESFIVTTQDGKEYMANAIILATGGASYTGTGSTGDGYKLAQDLGHSIVPIRPALVPLRTASKTAKELQGLALKNVRALVYQDGEKMMSEFGEMLFTHFGLSGPIILTLSGKIVDSLAQGHHIDVSIDLKPALDRNKLDQRLLREFDQNGKKSIENILKNLLPRKLIKTCLEQTKINYEKLGNQIDSEERHKLLLWLKDFRFKISESLPIESAIITAGGVALKEVDPKTLQSKKVKGLYFAGEVLDLDADTGGYNLQEAFSTGWLAGKSAADYINT